jgi:hypothetical protein
MPSGVGRKGCYRQDLTLLAWPSKFHELTSREVRKRVKRHRQYLATCGETHHSTRSAYAHTNVKLEHVLARDFESGAVDLYRVPVLLIAPAATAPT